MIDLVVINFNTKDKLERLVKTLFESVDESELQFRLNIVDNGSSDGSQDVLKNLADKYDITPYFFENIGYARACNDVAEKGSAPIVALLNADVWFTYGQLKRIQKSFDQNEAIAILGPKQRDEAGRIVHAGIFGSNEQPKHRGWKQLDLSDELYRDQVEAVTISGSAYFIRRNIWQELTQCKIYQQIAPGATGAFLPTPHYYEETFCSYHARAHEHKIFYDGNISIGHSWHASHDIGSRVDKEFFSSSQRSFRAACAVHNIPCD